MIGDCYTQSIGAGSRNGTFSPLCGGPWPCIYRKNSIATAAVRSHQRDATQPKHQSVAAVVAAGRGTLSESPLPCCWSPRLPRSRLRRNPIRRAAMCSFDFSKQWTRSLAYGVVRARSRGIWLIIDQFGREELSRNNDCCFINRCKRVREHDYSSPRCSSVNKARKTATAH